MKSFTIDEFKKYKTDLIIEINTIKSVSDYQIQTGEKRICESFKFFLRVEETLEGKHYYYPVFCNRFGLVNIKDKVIQSNKIEGKPPTSKKDLLSYFDKLISVIEEIEEKLES